MRVSILTAALPERLDMLEEARASVWAQEPRIDVEHLVTVDHNRRGAGPLLNDMLDQATGDLVMVLDDDDLLLPHHLATVVPAMADDVDVVYSMPRVEGGSFTLYEHDFNPNLLARCNIVSHNALMRTELVRQVGGWQAIRMFDWDLFRRLEQAGAEFLRLRDVTWVYRLHGSNWSQGTLAGAAS